MLDRSCILGWLHLCPTIGRTPLSNLNIKTFSNILLPLNFKVTLINVENRLIMKLSSVVCHFYRELTNSLKRNHGYFFLIFRHILKGTTVVRQTCHPNFKAHQG